jgi:hypothetical protein
MDPEAFSARVRNGRYDKITPIHSLGRGKIWNLIAEIMRNWRKAHHKKLVGWRQQVVKVLRAEEFDSRAANRNSGLRYQT